MSGDGAWFAIVDTAQDKRLYEWVAASKSSACLFSGQLPPVLAAASPYIVQMVPGEPLFEVWRTEGIGRNWGIMFMSPRSLSQLRKHFRRFLQVRLPDGTVSLFRFYDPRVFNTYLPAASADERAPWFEGITLFSVEGTDPKVPHSYTLADGQLLDHGRPAAGVVA